MSARNSGGSDDGDGAAGLREHVDAYLTDKGKGQDGRSGNYRRNAGRVLERFVDWADAEGVNSLDALGPEHLRRFVREELRAGDYAPRTVHKYYDYVSAFIGWAEREGLVAEHIARKRTAKEPLPDLDKEKRSHQQTWRPEQRQELLTRLDEAARDAIEAEGAAVSKPIRDRALVAVLAYSGVRAGELLAARFDDRRVGVTWADIGDDYATLTVLSKDQAIQDRAVPPQARTPLKQWERVLDPEPEWPLFLKFSYAALYGAFEKDVAGEFDGRDEVFEALRARDRSPPSITTEDARRLLERLTEKYGIDVDGDHLQLHGARRGAGLVLATQQGADAAADQLGNSVRMVEEAYSDVLAEERAEKTGEAFENVGG